MASNWLKRARELGTPFIDGEQVTFYWHGAAAPRLMGDFCDWEDGVVAMQPLGRGHWGYTLTLPPEAYMEYAFIQGEQRLADPFNPRRTPNGMGKTNHYFYMPDGKPTSLTHKRRSLPAGTLTRHAVLCQGMLRGKQRTVYLYQPPVAGPVPLLVVWDGKDYLRRARLPAMLENLLDQQRIQPVALALIEHGGEARWREYQCSESTLVFLLSEVLPLARAELDLLDPAQNPGAYGVLGASMGGLMAMYTGLRLPHLFGRILSQSGAFALHEGWRELAMDLPGAFGWHGQQIWMDIGLYDMPALLTGNRIMHQLLLENGFNVAYREYPAGHNYPAWRDDIWRGLEDLFPPAAEETRHD